MWHWRPWVAVTGESTSGKTVVMDYIAKYFGVIRFATSNTTEAGIRNNIKNDSRILMHDEFENSPHRTQILEMMMASNRAGAFGKSYRSNAAQGSVEASYELLPWFSGVEMKMDKQTEANRYILFEFGNRDGMEYVDVPLEDDYHNEIRNKSIAIVMICAPRIRELSVVLTKGMGTSYTRQGESYALSTAVYAAICGMSDEEAMKEHQELMGHLEDTMLDAPEKEQNTMLDAILSSQVRTTQNRLTTIGTLISMGEDKGGVDPDEELGLYGIVKYGLDEVQDMKDFKESDFTKDEDYVFFDTAKSSMIRRQILKGTDYAAMNVTDVLARVKGAFKARARSGEMNGDGRRKQKRGVFIPASAVSGKLKSFRTSAEISAEDFVPNSEFDNL